MPDKEPTRAEDQKPDQRPEERGEAEEAEGRPDESLLVVGIGASAGGLEPLKTFFAAVPESPGMAFVVIQHLDPTKESLTPELLGKQTAMPVRQVTEDIQIARGHVYVIPPNKYLSISGGVLRLSAPYQPRGTRVPVDHFLRSLAKDAGPRAVGIILSGTGTDGALVKDLLISVTDFFRDPEAWEALRGERKNCSIQIFASDIDADALMYARLGRYPKSIEEDLSSERLKRFFNRREDDHYYEVSKTLRECVVFADQNLISDPPFSKLDLVCCRNLLIYLKPDIQQKIIGLFHFALQEGGFLFLGTSETIGRQDELFEAVSNRLRLYRRVGKTRHDQVNIPVEGAATQRDVEGLVLPPHSQRKLHFEQVAQRRLVDWLSPSAVLIDARWKILYICGDVDSYLTRGPGTPTDDLLANARRGLRTKLRAAVHKALEDGEAVHAEARVYRNGSYQHVRLAVQRFQDREFDQKLVLILFEDAETSAASADGVPSGDETGDSGRIAAAHDPRSGELDDDSAVRQLEDELAATKEDLQTTIEQLETSNEEYKASNEEVMSMNEELQSTNEELETSKEELQSLNEELTTVNNQLANKVDTLEEKQDDLENLLAVTDVATLCLNRDLTIRWFTPAIRKLARVTSGDVGRPITHFTHDFIDGDLPEVAERVLGDLTPVESEVTTNDDRTFIRRVVPYRMKEDRIRGVVVTFVDITERKKNEDALQAAKEFSDKIIDTVREGMLVLDEDLRVVSANESFFRKFEVSPETTVGTLVYELGNKQWDIPELRRLLEDVLPTNKTFDDLEVDHHFESIGHRVMLLNGRRIDHIQWILLSIEDITRFRVAEQRRRFLLALSDAVRSIREPQRMVEEATSRVCRFMQCDRALYLELDLDHDGARVIAQHAERGGEVRREHKRSDYGREILQPLLRNEPLVIDDVREDRRVAEYGPAFERIDTRALLCIPRRNRGRQVALFAIGFRGAHDWVDGEIDLAREVANRTWSALDAAHAEQEVRTLNETLERQVAQRTAMLEMLQDITRVANEARTVEEGMLAALRRISRYNGWQVGHVWQLADDGSGQLVDSGIWLEEEGAEKAVGRLDQMKRTCRHTRISRGDGLAGRVLQSGEPFWIDDFAEQGVLFHGGDEDLELHAAIAFPVTANGRVVAVLEFFSDLPAKREERFMEIMPDVGIRLGHLFQRKELEREIADATEREQRRIGGDIHDDVGQELTGVRYLANVLAASLEKQASPKAETAGRVQRGLETVQRQLRSVLRRLVPVELDEKGLQFALRSLADRVSESHAGLECSFEFPTAISLEDNLLATHVYRIAQEAVTNAVKHAEANRVTIRLTEDSQELRLEVNDDGVGIGPEPWSKVGFGLRSMRYRADLVGARLEITGSEGGGTHVSCVVPYPQVT